MPIILCNKYKKIGLLLLFFQLFCIISYIIICIKRPLIKDILETNKCPFCYGLDACPNFYNNSFKPSEGYWDLFISFINVKNIYYGDLNNRKVLLKKLAHKSELDSFNDKVCKTYNICGGNVTDDSIIHIDWKTEIRKALDHRENINIVKNLVLCPDTRQLDFSINHCSNGYSKNHIDLAQTWTLINVNGEPLLLKYLNEDDFLWPVPSYFGACGRSVLVEYAGVTLSSYKYKDVYNRIDIAHKLLKLAFIFTFQHDLFRFYLTDVTTDNIAINDNGYPIVIDLENVIILYKGEWKSTNHSSEVLPCDGCFIYSTEDICSHHLSDHNIYAFCHLIKEDILNNLKIPYISELLQECVKPVKHKDRFYIANLLIEKFVIFINNDSKQKKVEVKI